MKKIIVVLSSFLLFVLISVNPTTALTIWDPDKFMDVDELSPGMEGLGKTVLYGTEITSFPVEIVDVIPDPLGDLILIRFTDSTLPRLGLASGMSGSPVYVQGRLIGAIGYGWSLSDNRLALVTPIRRMLNLWEWGYSGGQKQVLEEYPFRRELRVELPGQVKVEGRSYTGITYHLRGNSRGSQTTEEDILHAYPAETPLLISGLEGRALHNLQRDLEKLGCRAVRGGGIREADQTPVIEPGSAVAVQLVKGDVNVSSIGTITYRDRNRILAFGHPFLNKGNVNLLLSGAYIHTIVPSMEVPFKLGSPLQTVGIINQDRTVGISGMLDRFPKIIPVRIRVNNLTTGRREQLGFQMVREDDLILPLATNSALQILDNTLEHIGYGSAHTRLTVIGSNLPDHKIVRENFYYSSTDISAAVLQDFYTFLNLAVNNPFSAIEILDIELDVEIEKEHKVALVEELQIENEKEYYLPGDTVELKVKIRPWRKEPFYRQLKVQIPGDFESGQATLVVAGGSEFYQEPPEEQGEENPNIINLGSLKDLIQEFVKAQKNNQLVVQILPPYSEENMTGEPAGSQQEVKELFDFDYVLEGMLSYQLKIQGQEDQALEQKEDVEHPVGEESLIEKSQNS